ncbi:MAG TPA: toll/interleukin-1 receptor domain-containing protein [Bryobacteraceae bacterium]|nr:toll/interleukin-1 receptor domain-containing protein [Bryobacteraceae bacterium]
MNSRFDAFFSHASKDSKFAARLVKSLEAGGLTAWIDQSSLAFGGLLRKELQSAIRDSRVLVLLWSEAAFQSRWVMAEMFTAFHLRRFIIPCVLDATPLPQFLGNAAYLDRRRDKTQLAEKLCRSVRAAPGAANQAAALLAGETPVVRSMIDSVALLQSGVLEAITKDFAAAAKANTSVGSALKSVRKIAPLHPEVLNLSGYQCKNDYMFKHWDAIQAGRAPEDALLGRGERYFFETLCVNPSDPSAVNGLGSILFFERELDAAGFFQRRAVALAKRTGGNYEAAKQDLEMTLRFKRRKA